MPRDPKTANEGRHPCSGTASGENQVITSATSGGVNAPPQRAASHMAPCARTRSFSGSQMVKILVRLGKQPAPPPPNMKRAASSPLHLLAHPPSPPPQPH